MSSKVIFISFVDITHNSLLSDTFLPLIPPDPEKLATNLFQSLEKSPEVFP
jgi:hypothetical protein